jgi:hypothetical protein
VNLFLTWNFQELFLPLEHPKGLFFCLDFIKLSALQPLKIDRTRCLTPANYAKKYGKSRSNVYKLLEDGKLPTIEIDGIIFIYVERI